MFDMNDPTPVSPADFIGRLHRTAVAYSNATSESERKVLMAQAKEYQIGYSNSHPCMPMPSMREMRDEAYRLLGWQ
jgi:hypothetical protein